MNEEIIFTPTLIILLTILFLMLTGQILWALKGILKAKSKEKNHVYLIRTHLNWCDIFDNGECNCGEQKIETYRD